MQTTAGAVADFGERLPKFSARSPISLLEEALRSWEAGDRQTGSQRLREFSIEHLRVLPAESHTECASLLLRLASVGRNNENSEACLRFTLNILQSTSSIHAVWSHIYAVIIGKDEKNDSNILKRVQLDTAVLALFEEAVSNSVVSESQLEIARQVASRSLHSDDFERRIAAIHFYIAYAIKDESTKSVDELLALEKLLCDLCEDRDSRVRFAAIRGISMLSDSRKSLSFYIYSVAKMLSENTEKFVRLEALKILKDFADRQPET
ncbi:unnamed protein product [Anisakis simplex]|uniref:Adaptin_N domain-containing protein n=1 Tax=Anisakis simplex TaxID=6269 RepID=A0A0M3J5U2_ANISI|nr:unnamed protein product [Anisakis simplex]